MHCSMSNDLLCLEIVPNTPYVLFSQQIAALFKVWVYLTAEKTVDQTFALP